MFQNSCSCPGQNMKEIWSETGRRKWKKGLMWNVLCSRSWWLLMARLLCALCKGEQERKASSFQGFSSQVFFFYWRHTSLKGDCPAPSPPALWRPGKLAAASQTASQLQFHLGLRFWQWRALLLVTQSFLTLCKPHGLQSTRLLCPRNFPVKNTGEGSHSLLQGIFLTQGSKPSLLQCKQILYKLRHQASPNAFLGD